MKMYLLESLRDVAKAKKHRKHEKAESKEQEHEEEEGKEGSKVCMTKKSFKKEHKNLLKVLHSGKKKNLKKEAMKQKEEMRGKE